MKKLLICIVVGILAFQMSSSAQDYRKDLYRKKIGKFTNMRNAGIGLTIGGAVMTIVGITSYSDAITKDPRLETNTQASRALLGLLAAELGVTMAAGGVVLWAIGGSKINKYSKMLKSVSLNLNPNLHQSLSLAYRF